MTGFLVDFVFVVMSDTWTSHCRVSAAVSFVPASSSGPFLLPFPATEWHTLHFCAANTFSPWATLLASLASTGAASIAKPTTHPAIMRMPHSSTDCRSHDYSESIATRAVHYRTRAMKGGRTLSL